jgi:hypothetical protein
VVGGEGGNNEEGQRGQGEERIHRFSYADKEEVVYCHARARRKAAIEMTNSWTCTHQYFGQTAELAAASPLILATTFRFVVECYRAPFTCTAINPEFLKSLFSQQGDDVLRTSPVMFK